MITQEEEWRPVPGFDGYEVSSLGRVMSYRRRAPYELVGGSCGRGYRKVSLQGPNGEKFARTVHRLVALAFHGPRPEGQEIRHLDGDRLNNAASNLAYGSASENVLDRVRHGTHHLANKTHCPYGHPYDESNTLRSRGRRCCRACARAKYHRQHERKRAAAGLSLERSA